MENLCSWKNQKRKKVLGEKTRRKEERKGTTLSGKEKKILCESDLCQRSFYAGFQISNKEVVVNPKFDVHDVENEVTFSLCKYQP